MSKELDLGRVVGKDATINGENAIQLIAGNNIDIQQQDGTITIGVDNTHFNDKSNPHEVTAVQVGAVPTSRTINGKPLTENISLSSSDVGASPTGHSHDDKQDKLTGTPDQYVTFDENGNAVAKQKDYSLFGFQINPDESDPSKIIKYIAQNASYDPAFMDYTKDEFNYGDWADVWFIKNIKVVRLGSNGEIVHELNRDRYNILNNGEEETIADIGSKAADGNIMVGIPTVWIRYAKVNNKDTFYFSDQKLSDDFHAYAHTAADGSIMPYTYMAAYNGYKDSNGKLRSLSGETPTYGERGSGQIVAAKANNPEGKHMWDIDTFADRNLINLLLLLIGKSTDTQTVFGNGNMNGNSNPAEGSSDGILPTGIMNDKGLFWGSNADNLGVKVFGIENWWGNIDRRTQGLILDNGIYKLKLTYGTEDGSTVEGYNTTGEGYMVMDTGIASSSNGYIKTMAVRKGYLLPSTTGGSNSTYYCDQSMITLPGKTFAEFGGVSSDGSRCGALSYDLRGSVDSYAGLSSECLSCKPY